MHLDHQSPLIRAYIRAYIPAYLSYLPLASSIMSCIVLDTLPVKPGQVYQTAPPDTCEAVVPCVSTIPHPVPATSEFLTIAAHRR